MATHSGGAGRLKGYIRKVSVVLSFAHVNDAAASPSKQSISRISADHSGRASAQIVRDPTNARITSGESGYGEHGALAARSAGPLAQGTSQNLPVPGQSLNRSSTQSPFSLTLNGEPVPDQDLPGISGDSLEPRPHSTPAARGTPSQPAPNKPAEPAAEDIPDLYPPLKIDHDTRLITIESAVHPEDPIVCKSESVALHDELSYVALSHFWGEDKDPERVTINGKVLEVRKALSEALNILRRRGVTKLWVDNLCINQDDNKDKERQIPRMSVIYSHASEVLAWLGPASTDTTNKMEGATGDAPSGLVYLGNQLPLHPSGEVEAPLSGQVQAVQAVVNRPYWKRCWIIQEICVAQKVTVLCGEEEVDFIMFWENLQKLMTQGVFPYVAADVKEHLECLGDFRDQEAAKTRNPRMPLIQALLKSRRSQASKERDKIFAILQLAHDSARLVDTPNYSQPKEVIFWKLAHNMIHIQGHVAIILLARRKASKQLLPRKRVSSRAAATSKRHSRMGSADFRDTNNMALPSWVPMWHDLDQDLPKWITESIEWMPRRREVPETSHDGQTLVLSGWPLETIVSVAGVPENVSHPAPINPPTPKNPTKSHIGSSRRALRRQDTFQKIFRAPADVFTGLRSAILAHAMLEEKHKCDMADCDGRSVPGLAIATVLAKQDHGNTMIKQWWNLNKSLRVGDRELNEWADDIIKKNTPGTMCRLSQEIIDLSGALQSMGKYEMRLAVTSRCTFKVVYCESLPGDVICRVDHCVLPIVLRPLGSRPCVSFEISEEPVSNSGLSRLTQHGAQAVSKEGDGEAQTAKSEDPKNLSKESPATSEEAKTTKTPRKKAAMKSMSAKKAGKQRATDDTEKIDCESKDEETVGAVEKTQPSFLDDKSHSGSEPEQYAFVGEVYRSNDIDWQKGTGWKLSKHFDQQDRQEFRIA